MTRFRVCKDDAYFRPWRVESDGVLYARCMEWEAAMHYAITLTQWALQLGDDDE